MAPLPGIAQGIVVFGLPHSSRQKDTPARSAAGRTKAVTLPFWDDFSDTKTSFADPGRWEYGRSVRVNDGMAIRPPSLRTATFDGIDSVGRPYNPNDALAKGYADKLVSVEIDLTAVPEENRDSVFLSYQYQVKGNGEIPDAGDRLLVLFLDDANEWVPVDTIENDQSLDPTLFYTSFVKISDAKYFHEGFRFRIQNFARLSGPYDAWHVDYIYLNKRRWAGDTSFPDRTISEPLTGLFGDYRIVPADHFEADPSILTQPTAIATSMKSLAQPINYSTFATISYVNGEDTTKFDEIILDNDATTIVEPVAGEFSQLPAGTLPDILALVADSDTVLIDYKYGLNTRDNDPDFFTDPDDINKGDYPPQIYSPIDFRVNDTTTARFMFANKYAYDDGVAEYGAGLNQPGAQLAYQYHLVGVKQENITSIEMYFPRFGDESSQVFELRIWKDLNANSKPVYTETTTLQRSQDNIMWVKRLTEPVPVDSIFYIGWKQTAAAEIAVGLDKNTNTGDRMWYNIDGDWVQNTLIAGSLMIRPVFGEGAEVSGLEDELELSIYPNPTSGAFYFPGKAEMISVYDMTGRSIGFTTEASTHETKLEMPDAARGIYIIKAHIDGRVRTAKVLVR